MKIIVHDYTGHAFPVQLSRWLAAQGHEVLHIYSKDISTPKGHLSPDPGDSATLTIEGVSFGSDLPKYHLIRRYLRERAYARYVARRIASERPQVVLSGNSSGAIQAVLRKAAHRVRASFLYWLQDIYAVPIARTLTEKFGAIGVLPARYFEQVEYRTLVASDRVVTITEDFIPLLTAQGVEAERIVVEKNWAPLSHVPQCQRDNTWSVKHGLIDHFTYIYSGTLGLKHNPSVLAELAAHQPDAIVVVVSEGKGRVWLESEKNRRGLTNLYLFDYQSADAFPDVLASADVLLAILEPYAGAMSVPSKILSYFCAGRPILSAIPPENAAARRIEEVGAGLNVVPGDTSAFLAAAHRLRTDTVLRERCAGAGRLHAETEFDIDQIGGRFLGVMAAARGVSPFDMKTFDDRTNWDRLNAPELGCTPEGAKPAEAFNESTTKSSKAAEA